MSKKLEDGYFLDDGRTGIVYKPIKLGDYDVFFSNGLFFTLVKDEIVTGYKFYSLMHITAKKHGLSIKSVPKWPKETLMWGHDFLNKFDQNLPYLCIVKPWTVPRKYFDTGAAQYYSLYKKPSKLMKPKTRKHFGDIIDNL